MGGPAADLLTFTVYVVGPLNAAGTTAVATGTDGVERVSDQQDTRINGHFTFSSANEPVYYSVEGSGRLYVSRPYLIGVGEPVRRTISTQVVRLPSILIQVEAAAKLPHTSPDPGEHCDCPLPLQRWHTQHASEDRGSERLSPDGCAERTT